MKQTNWTFSFVSILRAEMILLVIFMITCRQCAALLQENLSVVIAVWPRSCDTLNSVFFIVHRFEEVRRGWCWAVVNGSGCWCKNRWWCCISCCRRYRVTGVPPLTSFLISLHCSISSHCSRPDTGFLCFSVLWFSFISFFLMSFISYVQQTKLAAFWVNFSTYVWHLLYWFDIFNLI